MDTSKKADHFLRERLLPHLERTYGEQRAQARANTESPLGVPHK